MSIQPRHRAVDHHQPLSRVTGAAWVNTGDIIVADEDGVAVAPKDKAADVLKKTTPSMPCTRSSRSSGEIRAD